MESQFHSDYFRAGREFERSHSVSAWVFEHQQSVVRGDLETEQQYPNDRRLVAEGILSDCVVPLISRGKSIGTLNVGSKTKSRYSDADSGFLQEVANQIALAVENMLFGHVKGAFTGAIERRLGRFELADGGTIFLDEVGELPLETQVKLLRVLQEHEFEPVGASRSVHVDVRVIAATNRNLEEAVRTRGFRADLFYRLNVFPLEVPPLRNRASDIPQLAMFFLARCSKNLGKQMTGISQETLDRLGSYAWPGNVRELENVVERATILSPDSILEVEPGLLPASASGVVSARTSRPVELPRLSGPVPSAVRTLEDVERSHIIAVLQQTGGVIEGPKGAARILDLHPNTLRHRMTQMGIKPAAHRRS